MAAYFWVGGTGNWDGVTNHFATTTGGTATVAAPTSADTVTFDTNSGTAATVTVTNTASVLSCTINKSDITLTLSASLNCATAGTMTLTAGTLNTNGQTCSWGTLSSVNSNVRTLTMGSSNITLTGTGNAWNTSTFTNLTTTTNTATITLTGASAAAFGGSGYNWNGSSLVFSGSGTQLIANSITCANLTRIGTAVTTDGFQFNGGTNTITGTLTLTGNSTTNRLSVIGSVPGTPRVVTAAAVALANCDFQDITATGVASPFTGTSLGDCLGNSGITFDTPVTQTWSGNTTGSWSTAANWTSRVPLPQDNVIISGLTSGVVTANMPRLCKNLDFTGSSGGTFTLSVSASFYGNLTFVSGMTSTGSLTLTASGRSGNTINFGGIPTFSNNFAFAAVNSTYSLIADMTISWAAFLNNITSGTTVDFNGFNFNGRGIAAAAGSTLKLGSGTHTLQSTGVGGALVWTMAGTVVAGTSTIVVSTTTGQTNTLPFTGNNQTFNNLTISGVGTITITVAGSNTFNNISATGNPIATVLFTAGTTQTLTGTFLSGVTGKLITLQSTVGGTAWNINKVSDTISSDFISLQDSHASGGAFWYAGANSTNVSGNTGWVFTAPPVHNLSASNLTMMGV